MCRNLIDTTWGAWTVGLLCTGWVAVFVGCTQQNSRGRIVAATDQDHSRGTLGVELRTDDDSITITKVAPDSPAAEAGLREGDEVVSVDGQAINSAASLQSKVGAAAEGPGQLAIEVRRNGSERTLQADLTTDERAFAQTLAEQSPADQSFTNQALTNQSSSNQPGTDRQVADTQVDAQVDAERSAESPSEPPSESAGEMPAKNESITEFSATADASTDADASTHSADAESSQHVVGYRGAADESSRSEASAEQQSGTNDANERHEQDGAGQRPSLASKPDESTDSSAPQQSQAAENTATSDPQSLSKAMDATTTASSQQREVTLQEVEKELKEAKEALDGFIAQKNKIDYQQEMERQLREFDDRVATLEEQVNQLQDRLSQKQQHLEEVRQKRDQFISEVEKLDPMTASSWSERRDRIDAAWQALQDAYRNGASNDHGS